MNKENEKKFSGELDSDELENVAGGWCASSGQSMPKGIKNIERIDLGGGNYQINTTFSDGNQVQSVFGPDGKLRGSGDVFNK